MQPAVTSTSSATAVPKIDSAVDPLQPFCTPAALCQSIHSFIAQSV